MKTRDQHIRKPISLMLSLCMGLSLLPLGANAAQTDYSTPVPMLPVESEDISDYQLSLSYRVDGSSSQNSVQNNTISYDGRKLIIDAGLVKGDVWQSSGKFYDLEITGDNVRKELVKEGYTDTCYNGDVGSPAVFGFAMRFEDFNRRAGVKSNNIELLYSLFLDMKDQYTLEQLRQYSCAREFLDQTGFWNDDRQFDAGSQGYISPWEDTITPRAHNLGYDTVEAYMDAMVDSSGYDGWKITDDKEYCGYVAVKKSAVTKDTLTNWVSENLNQPVFEKDDEYYVRAVRFEKPGGNTDFYAMQARDRLMKGLQLDGADLRIESREDIQKSYRLSCDHTYAQLAQAWAQEMDTWSGHWDYLLNGDSNFDYWPSSDYFHTAGYNHGNYGSMGCICGAVQVNVSPQYRYYIEGPGDITVRVTGKNVNFANAGTTYNITGTAETVVHVTDDTPNPFDDVSTGDYFYEPVRWAVGKGITAGISDRLFGPEQVCTRGQIATFLWANAGKPEPSGSENPFSDVDETDYFYKAVLWAVENGITSGVGEGRFGPEETCTRAQTVTFLWAANGRQVVDGGVSFSDVSASDYYAKAVQWVVANDVTAGVGDGKFGPQEDCTRGQIVTFLYKAAN